MGVVIILTHKIITIYTGLQNYLVNETPLSALYRSDLHKLQNYFVSEDISYLWTKV